MCILITQQPYLGSLFKSQNASTWTPSQLEDMKFTLYKAEFAAGTTGTVNFYNPELGVGNNEIVEDVVRSEVEEAQLFIEAAHSCYARISRGEV